VTADNRSLTEEERSCLMAIRDCYLLRLEIGQQS